MGFGWTSRQWLAPAREKVCVGKTTDFFFRKMRLGFGDLYIIKMKRGLGGDLSCWIKRNGQVGLKMRDGSDSD